MPQSLCPCNPDILYQNCCQPYHKGKNMPQTAEQLMRSRYSAYALNIYDYIYETLHPKKRQADEREKIENWGKEVHFVQLEINSTFQGLASDKIGKVEFTAHYTHNKKRHTLHERSRFRRFKSHWFYYDGDLFES